MALAASLSTLSALAETKAQWTAALYGRSTDDRFSSSRTVGLAGVVHFQHDLSEKLQSRFLGGIVLETGSSSALFTSEFEPRSRILLQEASLRWRVINPVSVLAGALDQRHHGSPLLIESGTFPAAMLAVDSRLEHWILHFDSQAAIPTSQSLSTRSTGKENTPLLLTQKAILGWENSDGLKLLFRGTYFQYRNLTRGVAADSRFYGNTVVGIAQASRFLYQYEGFELGPDLVIPFGSRAKWTAGGSFLQNNKGPRRADQGLYAYTGLRFQTNSFALSPKIEWYRNEADSAPAFYTSEKFGHNNRKGSGVSLKLELPATGLEIDLKMRRSRLIEQRTFQKDRFDYLEISVGIPYADF